MWVRTFLPHADLHSILIVDVTFVLCALVKVHIVNYQYINNLSAFHQTHRRENAQTN